MRLLKKLIIIVPLLLGLSAQAQDTQALKKLDAKTALLIIDIQQFYFPGGSVPLTDPIPASVNAKKILKKFRAEKRLVVHVGHNSKDGASFHPNVKPKPGEKVIMKDEVSAFNGTDLTEYLKNNDIRRLVIVGMQTHMCVEGAVRAGYDLGFEPILVHDACATRPLEFEGNTIKAEDVHNSTLASLNHYATVICTNEFLKSY